jgi:hypothetical protein
MFILYLTVFFVLAKCTMLDDIFRESSESEDDKTVPSGFLDRDSSSHHWSDWSWNASSSFEDFEVPPRVIEQEDDPTKKNTTTTMMTSTEPPITHPSSQSDSQNVLKE